MRFRNKKRNTSLFVLGLLMMPMIAFAQAPSFNASTLNLDNLVNVGSSTFLQFGPDGRLYVVERYGNIFVLDVQKNAAIRNHRHRPQYPQS